MPLFPSNLSTTNISVFCVYKLGNDIKVRDLHSIQDWDVIYSKGDFFKRGKVDDNRICKGNINEEWFQNDDKDRRRLSSRNRVKSGYGEYSDDIFDRLNKKVGGEYKSEEQNAVVYRTWSQMDCEYLTMENKCERPKYFDDCSDMEICLQQRENGRVYNDIDITLQELIEKVSDYPCMVDTRETFYDWAKETGNLIGLCRGDYDTFCDRNFAKEQGNKCLIKQRQRQRGRPAIQNAQSEVWTNNYMDNDKNNHYNYQYAMMNGFAISIIICSFICCYWMIKSSKNCKTISSTMEV